MSETRMPRRVFLGYLGAAAVVGVADPRAFIKGLITPTTPSQQQGEQFPVAVEAHHGEEHENIVTDTIANLGVLRFGHALMTAAEQGHFSGQDWTEISAYLGAYLASLPSEKRNSEMSHLLRDTFILTAMVAGAYAGDAYLRAKEEMGLPTTMDIPGGYVVNEQVIDQILGSMRHEELVTAPINMASTGAAAIIYNGSLEAMMERLVVRPKFEFFKSQVDGLKQKINPTHIPMEQTGGLRAELVEKIDEFVLDLEGISGKTGDSAEFTRVLEGRGAELEKQMQTYIDTFATLEGYSELIDSPELLDAQSIVGDVRELQRHYSELKADINPAGDKFSAVEEAFQVWREYANKLGKLLGPLGDPPNMVIAIRMLLGEVQMDLGELAQMQVQGTIKSIHSILRRMQMNEIRVKRAWGIEVSDEDEKIGAKYAEIYHSLRRGLEGGLFKKYIKINTKLEGLDEATITDAMNGDNEDLLLAIMGVDGDELDRKERSLLITTGMQMIRGILGFASERKKMSTGNPQTELKQIYDDASILKENREINNSRSDLYSLLRAIAISSPENVAKWVQSHDGRDTYKGESIEVFLEHINDSIEAINHGHHEDDLLVAFEKHFGSLRHARADLIVAEVEMLDGVNVEERLNDFTFESNAALLMHELLPTMIDKLGHGTEEVGALVGLQFITGPMITHVIERYVIEPMIEESSGGAIDEDELEKVMVMLGSGSPGADNALLVNISISVLEKLFHEGRLSPEGYKRIVIRVWNGDIEAGELYKAGGPASAPFSDNPMNGPRNGLVTTLADYGSNYQIPGLPDGVNHITQLDIIKNWVYFEGLMGLSRNRLIKAIGGMIPDELINTLAQGGMGLVNLSKMVNPAAVLRIPQGMFNRSGNDLKITMLSKAWEKLDMAKNH